MTYLSIDRSAPPPAAASDRSGTQSLARGVRLMRVIATRPQFGWRLSDLAAVCGLDKGTVHRMLACLVDERLVEQRASDRHYLPGPLMFELGLALPDSTQFQRVAESHLQPFARRLGGVVLLQLRSGNEYVCSLRLGALSLTALMVYPGTRRPLFTSAGGIAILQTLDADAQRRILLDNVAQEIAKQGAGRLEALQRMRERSARHGFGVNLGDVVPGVHAFGVPVTSERQGAFAAVCLIGTTDLYGAERVDEIRGALDEIAALLAAEARKFNM
ncbi:MAG: helix-turn-helix domain-containing protein [Rubrivivax sp.]